MFSLALRHPGLPLAEGTSSKEVEINVMKGGAARPEMEGQPTLGACSSDLAASFLARSSVCVLLSLIEERRDVHWALRHGPT